MGPTLQKWESIQAVAGAWNKAIRALTMYLHQKPSFPKDELERAAKYETKGWWIKRNPANAS
jgi:hypothetical protein